MAAKFHYLMMNQRSRIGPSNGRGNCNVLKPLSRLVYSTILFLCLTAAFYSVKVSRNIEHKSIPKEPKLLHLFKRQATDSDPDVVDNNNGDDPNNDTQPLTPTSELEKIVAPKKMETKASSNDNTNSKTDSASSTSTTITTTTTTAAATTSLSNETGIACEEPAYREFPADLFSNKQRAQGFVVIHILVGIYMFYALAIVCDEYFVASMEKICVKMDLSEDVAGATFMAAGSSAPELFTSLLGVFVAKGDVGTGTIVGSAVFNILFVIGLCGLLAGKNVLLNWWPLMRDSIFYSITIAVLIAILADNSVTWWESLIMLLLYVLYIVIMKYNARIHIWLSTNTRLQHMDELTQSTRGILTQDDKQTRSSYVQFTNEGDSKDPVVSPSKNSAELDIDEIIRDYPRKMSLYEAALKVMSSRPFRPRTRFRCAGKRIIAEKRHLIREGYPTQSVLVNEASHSGTKSTHGWESGREPDEEWKMVPSVAQHGIWTVIKWFVTIPVLATLHYTIPDCRNSRWERWYLLTFFTAMLWIAFFSYILVWMVTLVGYTFGVPDTIMGITFLAAGTSIPDAYSSVIVARQGMGDMAVSNSIGSNVFDILIGLALPWFMKTAIVEPNSVVSISSGGMVYNVILLFLSIAATIIGVHYANWQLNRRLGITLLVAYVIFLIFSLLIEFNVFGYVNMPECEE